MHYQHHCLCPLLSLYSDDQSKSHHMFRNIFLALYHVNCITQIPNYFHRFIVT